MTFEIQRATPNHAAPIAAIIRAVWDVPPAAEDYIAAVLGHSNRVTHIAIAENRIVGLVDGFLTISAENTCRWEVDLLAVLSDYRGQGIASQLVATNTQAGCEMGAAMARGLIAVGNIASEKAFARCGYQVQDDTCALYVSSTDTKHVFKQNPAGLYLLTVCTLNYRGIWLEGNLSLPAFVWANALRARYGFDVAGAVIPMSQHANIAAAQNADYDLVGEYRWWHYSGL